MLKFHTADQSQSSDLQTIDLCMANEPRPRAPTDRLVAEGREIRGKRLIHGFIIQANINNHGHGLIFGKLFGPVGGGRDVFCETASGFSAMLLAVA